MTEEEQEYADNENRRAYGRSEPNKGTFLWYVWDSFYMNNPQLTLEENVNEATPWELLTVISNAMDMYMERGR